MHTRKLHSGTTELEVSELCLGVMLLGVREDEATSFAILDRFFEAGGRFFDTSNNYGSWGDDPATAGLSERTLGAWIARRGVADQVVVATKCGAGKVRPDQPLSTTAPTNYEGLAPEVVRRELTGSLERLGLDRVGVYYGHVDDRTRDVTEIADTFSALVEEGLVTVPGLSNTTTWRLAVARRHSADHGRPAFGVWQQQHSAYWPAPGVDTSTVVDQDGIDYAAEHPGLTIVSYSPQQAGQLVRPWMDFRDPYDHPGSHDRLRLVHRIAHDLGATANQVVLAWHLAGPRRRLALAAGSSSTPEDQLPVLRAAMLPVIGASSVEQLEEALGAVEVHLDEEQLAALDAA
ncbi:aldo/keto reductase [Desertihabitans brevis]|uniref:Aldo/keto reductase n=1 Tax=Desertihabitans brevis TaxID=2268447 RepID=A0A367YSH8_9ACTN|nr:aldo/keto reductase [Desertihabitans brevis]RCK68707.1 aldo/keto reductase [Desertihabitans brevis]